MSRPNRALSAAAHLRILIICASRKAAHLDERSATSGSSHSAEGIIARFIATVTNATGKAANVVRLQLHALAYNLGNFPRTLATPEPIKDWSMTTLREKLIKIGAKVVGHARYVSFQMAEVAIPRNVFADILRMIAELRPPPITSTAW